MQLDMYLAENIRYLRESAGETQTELGEAFGVDKSTVCNYESGKTAPTLETVAIISRRYGVTMDDLVLKKLTPEEPMVVPNIRFLRERRGLSQEDVAKELGIGQPTYANYEAGRRNMTIRQLMKLSDFFNVTLDQLVKTDLSRNELSD